MLEAVVSKDFEKLFWAIQQGSRQADLLDFRRALDPARSAPFAFPLE
ncbi:MAG: hypothetical protein ABSG56_34330 [Bryobacteraceae bacterium]